MKNIFGMDSPVFLFLSKLCDMVILNILWLLCCIPVFTIGASTAALYRCTQKMHREGAIKVSRSFFEAFGAEFKQATALFGVIFAVLAVLAVDIWAIFFSGLNTGFIGPVIICILIFLIFPGVCYVFPLQSYFDNSVGRTLKNAFLMSISHFPISLAVAVLHLLPALLLFSWPAVFFRTLIVWLLIGGSLTAHFSLLLLRIVFKKYEPEET